MGGWEKLWGGYRLQGVGLLVPKGCIGVDGGGLLIRIALQDREMNSFSSHC